jgi:8-oxo-dGTP pyrophosphatase MutT (NUDIX family)
MNQTYKTATTLLPCAGLLYIENKKLLLAYSNNKQCFYLPGGKIDHHETAAAALCREVLEEMNVAIDENALQLYTHITAPAYGEEEGIIMEQDCFLLSQTINPSAAAEITALKFFSLEEYLQEKNQAPGAIMILQKLKADGRII